MVKWILKLCSSALYLESLLPWYLNLEDLGSEVNCVCDLDAGLSPSQAFSICKVQNLDSERVQANQDNERGTLTPCFKL